MTFIAQTVQCGKCDSDAVFSLVDFEIYCGCEKCRSVLLEDVFQFVIILCSMTVVSYGGCRNDGNFI